jgi:tRNA-dihydrouridine synthase B
VQKKELKIGNLKLDSPFMLAPLAGITDSSFRRLCKEQGAALVYSEMISAKGLYYNDKNTENLLAFEQKEKPLAYQLFGSEPKIMAWAVEKLSARENSLLDINMGCPVPKVIKNAEGSALMKNPKLAAEIVKAMVGAEKRIAELEGRKTKPITVKCRTGWDESKINVLDFAYLMEEAGASAIAVHGRTREQFYSGKADWEAIALVKEKVSIPVIGSGDVFSGQDANMMLEETNCDFVMIARGALGNPWIFREALALYKGLSLPEVPTLEDKLLQINKHFKFLKDLKGETKAVLEMRKHIGWYLKGVHGASEIRHIVNTLTDIDEIQQILAQLI